MDALDSIDRARRETADEIATLVRAYAVLGVEGRSRVADAVARALAAERWGCRTDEDAEARMTEVANANFPWGHDAARLIARASDVHLDAMGTLFQDGPLDAVLRCAERDVSEGEGVYEGYMMLRESTSAMCAPPHPAECLGIDVDESEFSEWVGDDLLFDREAHAAEVRRRCIEEIAGMVAEWRRAFFEALLTVR